MSELLKSTILQLFLVTTTFARDYLNLQMNCMQKCSKQIDKKLRNLLFLKDERNLKNVLKFKYTKTAQLGLLFDKSFFFLSYLPD